MKALAIAGTNVRRLIRDRTGLFFLFVFPLIIIVTLGAVFGGTSVPKMGLFQADRAPMASELARRLRNMEAMEVVSYPSREALIQAVERGQAEAGVSIPAGYEATLRSGGTAEVSFVSRPASFAAESVRSAVDRAVAEQSALVRAARFTQRESGGDFDSNLSLAMTVARQTPEVRTSLSYAQTGAVVSEEGRFESGAATQLVLFMFLTSLSAAAQLIVSRQLGVSRRMASTPTTVRTILAGETLGRFGVAMLQGLFIVAASALIFGVRWGDPVGTAAIVVLFALVGTGAAMLFGSVFRNDQQATALGTFLGLALAALGGCMVPLEEFSPTMQRIAHLIPHAWAVEGLFDLIFNRAGVSDILPQLAALAGFAIALLGLATWRLRRAIVG